MLIAGTGAVSPGFSLRPCRAVRAVGTPLLGKFPSIVRSAAPHGGAVGRHTSRFGEGIAQPGATDQPRRLRWQTKHPNIEGPSKASGRRNRPSGPRTLAGDWGHSFCGAVRGFGQGALQRLSPSPTACFARSIIHSAQTRRSSSLATLSFNCPGVGGFFAVLLRHFAHASSSIAFG